MERRSIRDVISTAKIWHNGEDADNNKREREKPPNCLKREVFFAGAGDVDDDDDDGENKETMLDKVEVVLGDDTCWGPDIVYFRLI